MANKLVEIFNESVLNQELTYEEVLENVMQKVCEIANQKNYAHYFDIRTNHLNEKDWRRSFSINQFLLGIILYATADNTLHNSFDEVLEILKKEIKNESPDTN